MTKRTDRALWAHVDITAAQAGRKAFRLALKLFLAMGALEPLLLV